MRKNAQWTLCAPWEKKLPRLREKTPQRVVCVSSHREGAFFFSQKNTEEQNTQQSTETLSQPISQNLTATFGSNALWTLYAGGLLWARNCVPQSSVNSVCSVREKTPQREKKIPTHYASSLIGVTSHTTPLSIRRGVGGEAKPVGVTSHTTPLAIRRGAGGEVAVISIREGTVLLFYHVTFLSPNNALHKTKKVTNLSYHMLFTCLIIRYKDR